MPTYEYRCKDCGHELETQQSFDDEPLTECPACGGALRKRFGAVGISFKGSGFYKTDSRGGTSGTTTTPSTGSSSTESPASGDAGSSSTTSTGTTTTSDAASSSSSPGATSD